MKSSPIPDAARDFLELLRHAPPLRNRDLAKVLDQIAAASHPIPGGRRKRQGGEPPLKVFAGIRPPFDDPVYYTVVDPLGAVDQKPYSGSVADDINDLGNTMAEALWRLDHNGRRDAHYFLRALRQHWELHLRELSLYLYFERRRKR